MKKKNIGLIGNAVIVIMLGLAIYLISTTIANTEITPEQIKDFNPFITVIIVWIVVPCIAIPIAVIINWERIKKLYFNKTMNN